VRAAIVVVGPVEAVDHRHAARAPDRRTADRDPRRLPRVPHQQCQSITGPSAVVRTARMRAVLNSTRDR
jgi:hypothetical protein